MKKVLKWTFSSSDRCLACASTPVDKAHIKSKGSGGSNHELNLIPLCRRCHRLQHDLGWGYFLEKHPPVAAELQEMGWNWEYDNKRFVMWNEDIDK